MAAVAAVESYGHAYALVRVHDEAGWTGHLVPLTVDGLIYEISRIGEIHIARTAVRLLRARFGKGESLAAQSAMISSRPPGAQLLHPPPGFG